MKTNIVAKILVVVVLTCGYAQGVIINGTVDMDFTTIDASGGGVNYTYSIGVNEVTFKQFNAAVGVGSGNENEWVSALGSSNAPVARVSFHEAARYCNWLTSTNALVGAYAIDNISGKVTGVTDRSAMSGLIATHGTVYLLPTEEEWNKAAYYTGSGFSTYANGGSAAPTGSDSKYNTTAPWIVGSGVAEQNGTYDMMGNIWEWTESAYDGDLNQPGVENMAFFGGGFESAVASLQYGSRAQDDPDRDTEVWANNIGLRVVAIPEPGTISLMSLSTIGLFITRRIRRRKLFGGTLMPVRRENLCDTYCTLEELVARRECVEVEETYLDRVLQVAKTGVVNGWVSLCRNLKKADLMVVDKMALSHERGVARRKTFRQKLRKKALDGFDAFLALIMK